MALSMTGYGRAEEETEGLKVTVEARSVNHRFMEVNVKSTGRILPVEELVRKAVKERFTRGYFEVSVTVSREGGDDAVSVTVNEPLLAGYMKAAVELSNRFDVPSPPAFGELLQIKDLFSVSGQELSADAIGPVLKTALAGALGQVEQARAVEGAIAARDIQGRLSAIAALVERIEAENTKVPGERFDKLKAKVDRLAGDTGLDENRLIQEAAILADKLDVSEEIDRLKSHLAQMGGLLALEEPVGRKLEFFTQEINREANTIGSKSASPEATNLVVEIKSEVEKIREQAQNIE
ncbi:MAG: YicC/YloC family endoribonuclease [Candidatus Nitrospinota bacterium M3_3B_026]